MKIAICSPMDIHWLARFSGVATDGVPPGLGSTATTPLVIDLIKRGHEVTVYTLSNGLPQELLYEWGRLRVFVGPSRQYGAARTFFHSELSYLKRVIQQDAPRFVSAHWTYEFALGALAAGVPTVVTIHDLPWNVLRYFRDRHRAVRLLMAYAVALRCRHFTAVSKDAAIHFARYLRPGTSIPLIPNYMQDRTFDMGNILPAASPRPFTFVTILQGWSRRKNPMAALQAFAQVHASHPQIRLVMLGYGYEPDGPAYRWARSRNLDAGVDFRGLMPYEAMLKFLVDEVDALVHPSLDEALSMTALECMALRKPIVAGAHTPGMSTALDNGRVGLLVDVSQPARIAEAMQRLLSNGELRASLARDAYEHAWNNFRADVVIPQYEKLYERLFGT